MSLKQITFAFLFTWALVTTTAAQEINNGPAQSSSLTITAATAGDRVRITAPSSVVQLRTEVYSATGQRVLDNEVRGGNVFDWLLQDGQAQQLAPGDYVCVITAKSVSGRITQKIGAVRIGEKEASVEPATSAQLSPAQIQSIGPVEENSSWTVSGKDEPLTPTVIANDGTDGQMIRGRGALTFRVGNFFTGNDQEQMRLTEEGNLGIGTSQPKASLDVAGTIRAERFLVAKSKLARDSRVQAGDSAQSSDPVDSVQPLIAGTGTQNRIARWTDNAGTLGDSAMTEIGGNVGIGTTTPGSKLVVSANSATLPPASGVARFADADGVQTAVFADAFGTNPIFNVRRANGTAAAPSAVQANQLLGVIGASGYGASAYAGTRARVGFFAAENWTDTANGTYLTFNTTANGTNTGGGTERMRIASNGNVGIGTSNPVRPLEIANGQLRFSSNFGDIEFTEVADLIAHATEANPVPLDPAFRVFTGTSGTPALTVLNNGTVGIGTATPLLRPAKLQVEGDSQTGVYGAGPIVGVNGESSIGVGVVGFSESGVGVIASSASGNLAEGWGVGRGIRKFHIDNNGTYTAGSDFAEAMSAHGDRAAYEPGDVLVVSTKAPGKIEKASRPYDQRVAGIYSTRPGVLGADKNGTSRVDKDDVPVAIVGMVPTKVSAMNGRIRVGDLLTTSSTPGYAMRCANRVKCVGAIVGKALEPLANGKGVIKVLVMLR